MDLDKKLTSMVMLSIDVAELRRKIGKVERESANLEGSNQMRNKDFSQKHQKDKEDIQPKRNALKGHLVDIDNMAESIDVGALTEEETELAFKYFAQINKRRETLTKGTDNVIARRAHFEQLKKLNADAAQDGNNSKPDSISSDKVQS